VQWAIVVVLSETVQCSSRPGWWVTVAAETGDVAVERSYPDLVPSQTEDTLGRLTTATVDPLAQCYWASACCQRAALTWGERQLGLGSRAAGRLAPLHAVSADVDPRP